MNQDSINQELLAAAEALVEAKDRESEEIEHYKDLSRCWRRLRKAVRQAKQRGM